MDRLVFIWRFEEVRLCDFFQEFALKKASDYEDVKTNLGKKYWMGQSNLVIKGARDFSKMEDVTYEVDRLKEFALLRLQR